MIISDEWFEENEDMAPTEPLDEDDGDEEDDYMSEKEPPRKVAKFASYIMLAESRMQESNLRKLMDMANQDPEIVREAIDYHKAYKVKYKEKYGWDEDDQGRFDRDFIVLLTVYFLLKYPEVKPEERVERLEELLERQGCPEEEARQDIALMGWYEDLLIGNIRKIYIEEPSKKVTDELERAMRDGTVDKKVLKMAEKSMEKRKSIPTATEYLDTWWKCSLGMAFINFSLSGRLKNVASVCFAIEIKEMIYAIARMDMRGDFQERGGNFDEIFGIDSGVLIRYASILKRENILREQFRRNREAYLSCMDDLNFENYHYMNEIVRQLDPEFHKERAQRDYERQREELLGALTMHMEPETAKEMKKYLKGEKNEEALYALAPKVDRYAWWSDRHWKVMGAYRKVYGYDAPCRRCEAALIVCRAFDDYQYLFGEWGPDDILPKKERVREFFHAMEEEKIALHYQLNGFTDISNELRWEKKLRKIFVDTGKEVFRAYLDSRPEEMEEAVRNAGPEGRVFGVGLLVDKLKKEHSAGKKRSKSKKQADTSFDEKRALKVIIEFAQDKSKEVKDALVDALCKAKDFEEDIVGLLSSPKVAERIIAVKVLTKWKDEKYAPILKELLAKETSERVRKILTSVFPAEAVVSVEGKPVLEDMVKELHKGNKKRSLGWAYETPFSKVHKKDGEEAGEEYLQAILLAYSTMPMKDVVTSKDTGLPEGEAAGKDGSAADSAGVAPYGISPIAAMLARELKEEELGVYVNELLEKWIAAGTDTRRRWVLYPAAMHGGIEMPERISQLVQEWPTSYGTVASEAVRALTMSLRPEALTIVDGMARKFKSQKVKNAAGKALARAAAWQGTTKEGLLDRTVPDLGFDEKGERSFDYGERKFILTITVALGLEVSDGNGKKLKSLPKPTKTDDQEKAPAAFEEYKNLKKQLKTVVADQKRRMEKALSDGREWDVQAWKDLFVRNPLMHRFAIGIIWGVYEDRELKLAFRYMEDGSFNTENGEETQLPESGKIGIVHPVELSDESEEAWQEQLEDYEVTQPIEQLGRPTYGMDDGDEEQKKLGWYEGCVVEGDLLKRRLREQGWYEIWEEDVERGYAKMNEELCLGVELVLRYNWNECDYENMTVTEAKFYTGDVYGVPCEDDFCLLKEVPDRYYSEVVLSLSRAIE